MKKPETNTTNFSMNQIGYLGLITVLVALSLFLMSTKGYAQSGNWDRINETGGATGLVDHGNGVIQLLGKNQTGCSAAAVHENTDLYDPTTDGVFNQCYEVYFGCPGQDDIGSDSKGDGLAFSFSKCGGLIGNCGGDMGYGGMCPQMITVEFDSYSSQGNSDYDVNFNGTGNDDEVAIHKNGSPRTDGYLTGTMVDNLEDGLEHTVCISYDPSTGFLTVSIDGETIIDYEMDASDRFETYFGAGGLSQMWSSGKFGATNPATVSHGQDISDQIGAPLCDASCWIISHESPDTDDDCDPVAIEAFVSPPAGNTVDYVDFFVNGGRVGTVTEEPWVFDWTATGTATYAFRAQAFFTPGGSNINSWDANVKVDACPSIDATITTSSDEFCEGLSTTLYASPKNASYSYEWFLGGVSQGVSTMGDSTFTATEAGDYTVIVSNGSISGTSAVVAITENLLPTGAGVISPTNDVCANSSTEYTVSGYSNVDSYTWSVSSGASEDGSSDATNTITASSSNFTITVTPTNACGSGTLVNQNITLTTATGNAGTIVGANDICDNQSGEGYSIDAVPGATSYIWDVDGATLVSGQGSTAILVDFGTSASYTISVTPSGECGDGAASDVTVVNAGAVVASVSIIQSPAAVCVGADATFEATVTGGGTSSTIEWYVDGALESTGSLTSYTLPSADGTENVQAILSASNLACATGLPASSSTLSVNVNPLPSGTGAISPTNAICANSSDTYTISGYAGVESFTWSISDDALGDGSTDASNDIAAGLSDFTITVTPENSCGSGPAVSQSISVNELTEAAGVITGTVDICDNQAGEGFSIPSLNSATGYTWTAGAATIVSGQGTNNVIIDFGTEASYVLEVTPNGLCGIGEPSSMTVNNTGSVTTSVSLSQDLVCTGSDALVVATVTGGGTNPTIEWYQDGVLQSTGNEVSYTVSSSLGSETVQAILTGSSLGCAIGLPAFSSVHTIVVEQNPVAAITDPVSLEQVVNGTSATVQARSVNAGENGVWSKPNQTEQGTITPSLTSETIQLTNLLNFETGDGAGTTTMCWTVSTSSGVCSADQTCVDVVRLDVTIPNVKPQSVVICETDAPANSFLGTPPNTSNGETSRWEGIDGAGFSLAGNDITSTETAVGVYNYVYFIDNSDLGVTYSDTVTLQIDAQPTQSNAGENADHCSEGISLNGNIPSIGTGSWSTAGDATINEPSVANSSVNGLEVGTNTFIWTISNGVCAASMSSVTYTVLGTVTTPEPGVYVNQCETTPSITLNANSPASDEVGTWKVEQGPGGISDSNSPNASLFITGPGTIELSWTISNAICEPDPVATTTVVVEGLPTTADAGASRVICENGTPSLTANSPGFGESGYWTGGNGEFIGSNENPTADYLPSVGEVLDEEVVLIWNISSGDACPVSADQVTIEIDRLPSTAHAGENVLVKEGEEINVNAIAPVVGTGVWSGGSGLIDNPIDPNTFYTPILGEYNTTLFWTVSNGVCPSTTDSISIEIQVPILIPNAFSPNGDGINETWLIEGIETYSDAHVQIFNRWGNVLYTQYGGVDPWDGTFNQKELPVGTYYYVLDLNNGDEPFTGYITLMR